MAYVYGSCNNLDADFGSWILCHCIALPGFNLGCMRWLGGDQYIVVIYGTEYTLPHANNKLCTGHAGYCMHIHKELNAVNGGVVQWSWVRIFVILGVNGGVVQWSWARIFVFLGVHGGVVHGCGFESLTFRG
jgi:hypothetical protein